ncbi:MAG: hypothetical protein NT099_01395, partial [Candidatus Saganbacteria bacterium]|nr:hypothetical protein [Candidatus Saganbacteria bacterium]
LGGGVRLGLSYQLFSTLTLAGDMEYRNLKSSAGPQVFGHVGVEQQVTRGLVLRGGYDKDRWTAGGSLSFRPVELHYALQMSRGNGEQATQLVGVKIEL